MYLEFKCKYIKHRKLVQQFGSLYMAVFRKALYSSVRNLNCSSISRQSIIYALEELVVRKFRKRAKSRDTHFEQEHEILEVPFIQNFCMELRKKIHFTLPQNDPFILGRVPFAEDLLESFVSGDFSPWETFCKVSYHAIKLLYLYVSCFCSINKICSGFCGTFSTSYIISLRLDICIFSSSLFSIYWTQS